MVDLPHTILFGGSFNPLHIGHMRMALEVHKALPQSHIIFLPCASPALKSKEHLLPFSLRVEMLQKTLEPYPFFSICTIENERKGPSYSVDTVELLQQQFPGSRFGFILGSEYLPILPKWKRWEQLLDMVDLIVLAREKGHDVFKKNLSVLFPQNEKQPDQGSLTHIYSTKPGHSLIYIEQPLLCISSSLVRHDWLAHYSVDFLVPQQVKEILAARCQLVLQCWSG